MPDSIKEYNTSIEILFDSKDFRTNPLIVVKGILSATPPPPKIEKRHMIRMANLPLDADAINLLYRFAEQNDKDFYQAILLNDQLTDFNGYHATLLVNLAQHAGTMFWASHATKINQFKKILESSKCDASVIATILANTQSEDDWYNFDSGIDELIFSKLRISDSDNTPNDIANKLGQKDLVKLAARAKTLEHFQLILALPKTLGNTQIISAILNNKAFSLNNWYKPDFWRRRRPNSSIAEMTDEEKLIIIPYIKDTVLLEKIAENIQKTFEKDAAGALLSTESLKVATKLSNTVATNTQLNTRIAKHILNNIEVVKELSTEALNNLAKHATTDEQFKLLLSAKNADHSTADAVIQTANKVNFSGWRGVGRAIFSSLPRRIFRGIGNFFNKLFGINKASTGGVRVPNVTVANLIEDVFQKNEGATAPKFDFSRMSPTSRHVLMKAVTNAEIKPAEHDEYLNTLEKAGRTPSVAAKPTAVAEKKQPAIVAKSPSSAGVKDADVAFNSPVTKTKETWEATFKMMPTEIQNKLELKESDKTRCFFKNKTLGPEDARAFIEAVKLMEKNSPSQPLKINADNFTPEFVEIIMKELQKIKDSGDPVPTVTLWFNNFNDAFSQELQALVIAYNASSPKPAPLKEEEKTDPVLLQIAKKMEGMERQLKGLGVLAEKFAELEARLPPKEEETAEVIPSFLLQEWDSASEPGYTKNILSFSPELYSEVTKDNEDIQAFCNQMRGYFLECAAASEDCNIISLNIDDVAKPENIKGIFAIVAALAEIKERNTGLKMQIEFKNVNGQPINIDNFKAVGMDAQWTEFEQKMLTITGKPLAPDPQPPVAPHNPLGSAHTL